MISNEPIILIKNLSVDFGKFTALENVTFEVPRNSIFGFLGPNGAGKTTTIRVLLGLLRPSQGNALVFGLDTTLDGQKIRQECSVLLEHHGLYEVLSAEDNLRFYGRIWKIPKTQLKERIEELLVHIGLWERRKERVSKWSKGMKQKLAIARCFLNHPSLIFLDEPTSGLDPEAAASFRKDLYSIVYKEQTTVFLTTHNLDEAEKLCSHIAIINKGKLLVTGTPEELKSNQNKGCLFEIIASGINEEIIGRLRSNVLVNSLTYEKEILLVELLDSENISSIITNLVSDGVNIKETKMVHKSLEEVYLRIMEESK